MTEEKESYINFTTRCRDFLYDYVCDFNQVFVAGGIFPRLYHSMPISDVDMYLLGGTSLEDLKKEYINNFDLVIERKNFIKLSNKETGIKIDLINFHEPKDISYVNKFDFTICQMIAEKKGLRLLYQSTFEHIQNKELHFTGHLSHSGHSNILKRLKKYISLGYTIDDADLTVIYRAILDKGAQSESLDGIENYE